MKKILACFIVTILFPALCFCAEPAGKPGAKPLTLKECYQLARKQSELIGINSELVKQAEAHFLQAFGTLLPQVSFSRAETWQHSNRTPASNESFDVSFVFKQALFTGFKEFAQMFSSRSEKKQRQKEKLRAEELLFVDVSDAFYLLLELREDLKTLGVIQKAFTDRIDELNTRVKLGKSRTSEVVFTETQLYSLEDEIESVKSQESIAGELLGFLIGKPVKEIVESGFDYSLDPESDYLAKAPFRPDVQAAKFAWQAEKRNIFAATSGFLPTVNVEGDYFTHRSTAPSDSKWEGVLSVDVPIFEGTTTYGQVKEAMAVAKQSELLFLRAGRLAGQDIHDSYVNAQASFARLGILEKAFISAERNYDMQTADYKLGIVNNLDVLVAIQNLEDIRRKFNHVSYESKRFYWQLKAAADEINVDEK